MIALRDKSPSAQPDRIPSWVQDYALFLLDQSSVIVAWYGGAERLYGYTPEQVISHHVSMLNQQEGGLADRLGRDFGRAAASGHVGTEGFHCRSDSTLFWANTITMALKEPLNLTQSEARTAANLCVYHWFRLGRQFLL